MPRGDRAGIFRRRISLESRDGEVHGELADDFHHFAVRLTHDGGRAIEVEGEAVRVPWTTCPGATDPLRRMIGAPVSDRVLAVFQHTRPREQCTHLHDLACLALTHAARSEAKRIYDVAVPDQSEGVTEAVLRCDGEAVLRWQLVGSRIERATPADFDDLSLATYPFLDFLLAELRDRPAVAEAAWILQRALFVAAGRQRRHAEGRRDAKHLASVLGPACYTLAAERVQEARHLGDNRRDFSDAPDAVLDRDREPSSR